MDKKVKLIMITLSPLVSIETFKDQCVALDIEVQDTEFVGGVFFKKYCLKLFGTEENIHKVSH